MISNRIKQESAVEGRLLLFWFAQGAGEAGRRPPAEGGHTGKARVGGCAAGPVARPAPCTSYISAASFFSRPSARRSTSAKFVASM
mgnify:FL=1